MDQSDTSEDQKDNNNQQNQFQKSRKDTREDSSIFYGQPQPLSDSSNAPRPHQRIISELSDCENTGMEIETNDKDKDIEIQHILMSSGSTISSFNDLEWSPSFCTTEKSCDACSILFQSMKCDLTKQFWKDIDEAGPDENQKCHLKFFTKFLEKLKDTFPEEAGLSSKETINLLKCLLCVHLKDVTAGVKLTNVIRLTQLFGPIKAENNSCVLIKQLYQLIKRSSKKIDSQKNIKASWFVGEMSRFESEQLLLADDCRDSTYLVRISGTDGGEGDFALSVRHNGHCHHLKIRGNPQQAVAETPYHAHLNFNGNEFASLPDVVEYIVNMRTIDLDYENELEECKSVTCLRVYPKSPLNSVMSGYEKAKC